MKKYLFLLILISLFFVSCDFFKQIYENDNYVTSVSFKSGKYILYKGEADVCYVEAEPLDSFDWYETMYSVQDNSVCSIEDTTDRYCIVRALNEGSTILTVKLGNSEGKCVLTVRSLE